MVNKNKECWGINACGNRGDCGDCDDCCECEYDDLTIFSLSAEPEIVSK